ncbi:MAG TPA: GNAT family N-acetyltransferase [Hanamia sp.]|nr:GNAT family N-acetyltransferase [Hanamia sp.]
MKTINDDSLHQLFEMVAPGRIVVIPTINELSISAEWEYLHTTNAFQMVFEGTKPVADLNQNITPLTKENVPEMIELTQLTEPGPFLERTIEFGNYKGIFINGKLAAMAGWRMQPFQYVEISAVCTHPDFSRRGLGTALMKDQIISILDRGKTPFLHVRRDNENAINLYKRLGFTVRSHMNFYVLQKN